MKDDNAVVIPRWSILLALIVILGILGFFTSPKDSSGRPIFLSPGVKAINDYRRSVIGWHQQMLSIDTATASLLSGVYGSDLFEKSQQSQRNLETAFWLVKEIERTAAPTASTPIQELTYKGAVAYLEAARAALVWSSAPTPENLATAKTCLETARNNQKELEASAWLTIQQ